MTRHAETPVGWLAAALIALAPRPSAAAEDPCARVEAAALGLLDRPLPPAARQDLAPLAPASAVPALLEAARAAPAGTPSIAAYMALGLSRHAEALAKLRALPPPTPDERLGRALALLALGDATGTGTVTWALTAAPVEQRRQTARALSRMHQMRPRRMLYEALEDEDPEVRLVAAEVNVKYYSRRARRVLTELVASGPAPLRVRAAQALFDVGRRFTPKDTAGLPSGIRGPSVVRSHLASRRRNPRAMRNLLASKDDEVRAGAFAALVAAGGTSAAQLGRFAKVAVAARGAPAEAQLQMALALLGESEALDALRALPPSVAGAGVDVLWAFAQARAPYHRLDTDHAGRLASVLEVWLADGRLSAAQAARVYTAMQRADPSVGLRLARARLSAGGADEGWDAARAVVRDLGRAEDAVALLSRLPSLTPEAAASAVLTAGEVCGR